MKKLSMILSLLLVVSLVMVAFGCAAEEPEEVVPEGSEEVVVPEGPIPREEVSVDASYDGKEVEITAGNALIVTLESNATTGFKWELTELTNQPEEPGEPAPVAEPTPGVPQPTKPVVPEELLEIKVLELAGQRYEGPESENVVGGAGKEIWTFHAEEKGQSKIYMEYRRSWEEGVEPAKTFTLAVIVK